MLNHKKPKQDFWRTVIQKVESRLTTLQHRHLGSQLTLINSVLTHPPLSSNSLKITQMGYKVDKLRSYLWDGDKLVAVAH